MRNSAIDRCAGRMDVQSYWDSRAKRFGRRAVIDLRHSDAEYEALTRRQWEQHLLPRLRKLLRGDEALAVDFGCGPGRLTAHLAEAMPAAAAAAGSRAVGLDPTQTLLALAPPSPHVSYQAIRAGRSGLNDHCADVVFVCLVLGGLRDGPLDEAVREIRRLLRPGGLLFIVESTSDLPNPEHWTYRTVEEYRRLLDFINLRHVGDYEDLGERMAIMAGRRRPMAVPASEPESNARS
jgi:SAM-dependent methyltransferase